MKKLTFKNMLRHGLYFMAIGPFIGLTVILLTIFAFSIIEINWFDIKSILSALNAGFLLIFFGFFVAYFVGAIPAFITGAISILGKSRKQQILYAVLSGSFICCLLSLATFNNINFSDLNKVLSIAVLGTVFGGFCAFICINRMHKYLLNN